MSLSRFLKSNKTPPKANVKYAVTKELTDEKGNPLEWEIKHLSSKEIRVITEESTTMETIGEKGKAIFKVDTELYVSKLIVNSIVYPDLLNAELQNSYGVKTPEELIYEMVDNPKEYNDLVSFINELNGLNTGSMDNKISIAKN